MWARFETWKEKFGIVKSIRGKGSMVGLELVNTKTGEPAADETLQLVKHCHNNGLVALSCGVYGNVIRTLAPFVITDEQLEKGLSVMEAGLAKIDG